VDNEVRNSEDKNVIMNTQTSGGKVCLTDLGNLNFVLLFD
jgi:hypothetical protein